MKTKRIITYMLSVLLLLAISGCKRNGSMDSLNDNKISPTVFKTHTGAPTDAPTSAPTLTPTPSPTLTSTPSPTLTLTPTPTPTIILTPTAPTGVERINPYIYDWHNADLKKLLDETLNGRKIETLQGNERLNAELYTFWITYYIPNGQPVSQPITKADYYNVGEEILTDINSDGKEEKIKVEITQVKNSRFDKAVLTINDHSVELHLENALYTFAIVDIDTRDKYKQIIIGEYGPSDDPVSVIYTYDGKKIIESASLVGTISPEYQEIDIDGSGNVFTMERTDILQTWHYQAEYTLDESLQFTEVLPAKGYYETGWPVVVLKPLIVYENRDASSKQLTISDAQSAQLIGIDKQWVLIKAADGTQGWILADIDHCYNVLNGDVSVPAQDLLYDMEYYD